MIRISSGDPHRSVLLIDELEGPRTGSVQWEVLDSITQCLNAEITLFKKPRYMYTGWMVHRLIPIPGFPVAVCYRGSIEKVFWTRKKAKAYAEVCYRVGAVP